MIIAVGGVIVVGVIIWMFMPRGHGVPMRHHAPGYRPDLNRTPPRAASIAPLIMVVSLFLCAGLSLAGVLIYRAGVQSAQAAIPTLADVPSMTPSASPTATPTGSATPTATPTMLPRFYTETAMAIEIATDHALDKLATATPTATITDTPNPAHVALMTLKAKTLTPWKTHTPTPRPTHRTSSGNGGVVRVTVIVPATSQAPPPSNNDGGGNGGGSQPPRVIIVTPTHTPAPTSQAPDGLAPAPITPGGPAVPSLPVMQGLS